MLSRISLGCAALLALVATGCDKVPLTAPTGASVFISTASTFVPTGGTTQVTAFIAESGGTQVQNGTMVHFSTNLGRMDPVDAQTTNGYAVSTFIAGDAAGVADVRANSGSIGGSTTGDTTTNSNMVQITVGAAAVESVLLLRILDPCPPVVEPLTCSRPSSRPVVVVCRAFCVRSQHQRVSLRAQRP